MKKNNDTISLRSARKRDQQRRRSTSIPTGKPAAPKEGETPKLTVGKVWKELWAYVGPFLSLAGAWFLLTPSIEISTGANLDTGQQFQTQFVVANRGHVPVFNVHFSCGLLGPVVSIDELGFDGMTLAPIREFPAGAVASRGCFSRSKVPISGPLAIDVFYTWPLIGMETNRKAYFTIRETNTGFVMIPDVPPTPKY